MPTRARLSTNDFRVIQMGEGSLVHTVAIIGVACAAILVGAAATWYLLGALFPPESDDSILTLMPNDGLNAVGYADVKGEGIERLANYLGDVMGGKYLRGITGARIAIFNYTGDTGFVVYIQNKNKADLMSTISSTYGSSYSGSMFTTVNRTIGGKDVTILYSSSDYSQSSAYCLWEEGGYLKMMGFTQNNYYGYGINAPRNLHSCTDVLAQTYDSSASKAMLAQADGLKNMVGSTGMVYFEAVYATATNETLFAGAYGGDDVTNFVMLSRNQQNLRDSANPFCDQSYGGTKELVSVNGKSACYQNLSGSGFMGLLDGGQVLTVDRLAGEYKLTLATMTTRPESEMKPVLVRSALSFSFPASDAVWDHTMSYTIRVYAGYFDRTVIPGANVDLRINGVVVSSKVTDSNGEVTFDDAPLRGARIYVNKSGFELDMELLDYPEYGNNITVYLISEPAPIPVPRPIPSAVPMPPIQGATIISSCPYSINSSGTYALSGDLEYHIIGDAACISIEPTARNAILDCRGYSVRGSGCQDASCLAGTGVWAYGVPNIIVRNCVFIGLTQGVYVSGGNHAVLTNNSFFQVMNGINMKYSDYVTVAGNAVRDYYGAGIWIQGDSYTVANNTVTNILFPATYGIVCDGCSDSVFTNNTACGNTRYDIACEGPTSAVTGTANTCGPDNTCQGVICSSACPGG